ncbi:hypothetical protein [Pueribacillus sp. YX66]|uniref:hypothetical protein n=1 Tax=Pueribacillus sp. YX66 TaxID=3229242 RepID=UPI00358D98C7
MKKYLVFILSFSLLQVIFQMLTGFILIKLYVSNDLSIVSNELTRTVEFGGITSLPIWLTLLSATIAYILSQIVWKSHT